MISPTFWTAADEAELEVLCWGLVSAIADHAPTCETCRSGWPPCSKVGAAIQAVLDWRHGRMLASRAEHLRSGQDLVDFGRRLGFTPANVQELQTKWRAEETADSGTQEIAA